MPSFLQRQVNKLTSEISDIDAEIALLQAESCGHTGVHMCIDNQIAVLNSKKTELEATKTIFENKEATRAAEETTHENSKVAWMEAEQIVVDEVSSLFNKRYDFYLENILKLQGTGARSGFFDTYDNTENNFQKEIILKDYFSIN